MPRRRRDVAITNQYAEASFSLTGEDEAECIEGVGIFKYLGRLMDRSDDNWLAFRKNTRKARQVWGNLGKLIWKEGAATYVSERFHRAVVQVV